MEVSPILHSTGSVKFKNRDRCALCGVNRLADPTRKFFKFPKDNKRCEIWVEKCNKPYLASKTALQLHTSYKLCSDHFSETDYVQPSRHRLKSNAVPTFDYDKLLSPTGSNLDISSMKMKLGEKLSISNTFSPNSTLESASYELSQSIAQSPNETSQSNLEVSSKEYSPIISSTPKSSSKKRVFTPKTTKIRKLTSQIYYLKQKQTRGCSNPKNVLRSIRRMVPCDIYAFISCQINACKLSKYGRRWKIADKNLALKIYLASPKAYNVLCSHFFLPTKKTILKSISGLNVEPGFCAPVLGALESIAAQMHNRNKYCVISFDEITLKKGLQYNKKLDRIIGFENFGKYTNPKPQLATHALVFMVRGICRKWKQVFGIFFSTNTAKSDILRHVVVDAVKKIKECGLNPVCIVCDQGANNIKLYHTELGVTEEKPFFFVDTHKIYAIFDTPHLLKSLRNNFKNYTVQFYDAKNHMYKHAQWKQIADLYEFDKQIPHRSLHKLTHRHIYVDGLSKMNVSLAAQIFSNSVASSLMYYSRFEGVSKSAAVNTADFVARMNFLFDSVNSRIIHHKTNPYLSACSATSVHQSYWDDSISFFRNMTFITEEKNIKFNCISGWIQTLTAFRMLTEDLLPEIPYILMSRFTQDALENFFSQVRRKGGFNDHPTPADFLQRMRQLIAHNVIATCENANCEADGDETLIPLEILESFSAADSKPNEESTPFHDLQERVLFDNFDEQSQDTDAVHDYKMNISAYIAGYMAKKVIKNFDCEACKRDLIDSSKTLTESTLFIYLKEYDNVFEGLVFPTEKFITSVMSFGEAFTELFNNASHYNGIKSYITSQLRNSNFDYLTCNTHKVNLQENIIQLYANLMIFYKVKFISKCVNDPKRNIKKIKKLS